MENKQEEVSLHVIGTATTTNKKENQDSVAVWEGGQTRVVVIADGLGGGEYARYARVSSKRVTDFLIGRIREEMEQGYPGQILLEQLFREAKDDLTRLSAEVIKKDGTGKDNLFGTTVIVLIETEEKLVIAYAGNGAVWHIRSNFDEFLPPFLFPWNAINLLNPHSIPENGKEALYRLISSSGDEEECLPSVIEIIKDRQQGDIIMLCTDGIYSADQQRPGKNEKGVWTKYEPAMLLFFRGLRQYFEEYKVYDKASMEYFLDCYLEEIRPDLHDDATIGILVTRQAARHQREKRISRDEKHTDTQL